TEGFVNPANRGFTPAGMSGSTRVELSLDRLLFDRLAVSTWLSHARGGIAFGTGDPDTHDNSARLTLALPLSDAVSVSAGGNLTAQNGDGGAISGLPPTERGQYGVDLAVQAGLGRLVLAPT